MLSVLINAPLAVNRAGARRRTRSGDGRARLIIGLGALWISMGGQKTYPALTLACVTVKAGLFVMWRGAPPYKHDAE